MTNSMGVFLFITTIVFLVGLYIYLGNRTSILNDGYYNRMRQYVYPTTEPFIRVVDGVVYDPNQSDNIFTQSWVGYDPSFRGQNQLHFNMDSGLFYFIKTDINNRIGKSVVRELQVIPRNSVFAWVNDIFGPNAVMEIFTGRGIKLPGAPDYFYPGDVPPPPQTINHYGLEYNRYQSQ